MTPSPRSGRLGDQIQVELADILHRRFKDPRLGFFTLTGVEMTRDLRLAKVYVSAMTSKELETTLSVLKGAKGFLRSQLGQRIRIRFLPELQFFPDRSAEYGQRMEELLREVRIEDGPEAGKDDDPPGEDESSRDDESAEDDAPGEPGS